MSLHPSELKVGDVFWESCAYGNVQMRVVSTPAVNHNGLWEWEAENVNTKKRVSYGWSTFSIGPSLYWEPAYVGVDK